MKLLYFETALLRLVETQSIKMQHPLCQQLCHLETNFINSGVIYTSNVDNPDLFEIWYVNGPNVSLFGYKISGKSDKVKSIFTLPVKSSPLTSENNALSTTVIR